jgi:hypothetical protein
MDEMSMVRRLLGEPPPPPDVVAEGRERLFGPPAGAAPRSRPIRRTALRSAVALGLTGAVVAAALVATTLVPELSTSPSGGGPLVTDASARSVLLVAAVHAESVPTSGTYWHVRSMSRTTLPQSFGRGDNRYTLEQLSIHEHWTERNGQAWSGTRVWVRPKTREDEAAWRRDGAPSKWCSGETDTNPPEPICLHTAPGTASLTKNYFPFEVAEGHELTFAQLQRLPEDADALRAWLLGITRHDLDPSASANIVDLNVTQILANLLVYPPVPPGVRAAAYRALADMPNVTSVGPTRDELGRAGIGVKIAEARGVFAVPGDGSFGPVTCAAGGQTPGQIQHRCDATDELSRTLLIDPDTSQVLVDETHLGNRSDPITDTLILGAGWTNEKPQNPVLP